ncbi:MAG: precorrin-6A reductase [Lachnospiraceae bacterium]|nr:precorrin-6A reductase [Lachnospiraceae bacterium]
MYKKVLIFAGTIEGRIMAQALAGAGVQTHVCVATEYGESLLEKSTSMTISHERLNVEEMVQLMEQMRPELIIDATHPYAVEVTKNIKEAGAQSGISYVRLLRSSQSAEDAVYVASVEEAVEHLQGTTGNVFVTTGSKELAKFTALVDYKERVYARVLSIPGVVESCADLGFEGAHLICMQGPFSRELNEAMLRQVNASYLVTKESGAAGGFFEKCQAAEQCGAKLVVIGRPQEESGISLEECLELCKLDAPAVNMDKRQVTLVGIGMGNLVTMTREALDACKAADLVVGAQRMVEAVAGQGQAVCYEYKAEAIADYIEEHGTYKKVVIALSGDAGFFSGAKKLLPLLKQPYRIIPGISSMAYFCSKIGKAWDEATPVTLHGRQNNFIGEIQQSPKVFALIGTAEGVGEQCRKMTEYGLGDCKVWIGENMAYETECIRQGMAKDFAGILTEKLCVLYVENEMAQDVVVTHGLPDEAFLRDKVPMTKEEVRSITLSKLRLRRDSVIYDIGAGTGSVSVEMAKQSFRGKVYAIEKKPEAVDLLRQNKMAFAVDNMEIVEGLAPEAMDGLDAPTHAFIGGSSGNLQEIIASLLEKNPKVRIVLNAIALETVVESMEVLKKFKLTDVDIACVNVSKAKKLGSYNLMMGQNPVYVISCQGE